MIQSMNSSLKNLLTADRRSSEVFSLPSAVGVIGLGYVGLPLARSFAGAGIKVLGFDVDATKVNRLNRGESYIQQIPHSAIAQMREHGFEATDHFERLNEPDAILICVPTPLTEAREP